MKGVSVIVCCYNSSKRLPATLQHLAAQQVNSNIEWEIIIVNNASTDNTEVVAAQNLEPYKPSDLDFSIVQEPKPGLSNARKTGVKHAKYDYLVFCDDDNRLAENYINTAYRLIDATETIGAIGGYSTPVADIKLPNWIFDYEASYAFGKQGNTTGEVTERGYVCGAGMVTRKKIFEITVNERLPNILSDRTGKDLSSGGDYEYCQRLMLQGYSILYDESLVFQHYIPEERLTENYRKRLFQAFDESGRIIGEYREAVKLKKQTRNNKITLLRVALRDVRRNLLRLHKLQPETCRILFYFFNIGYKNRTDLKIIRHFYHSHR